MDVLPKYGSYAMGLGTHFTGWKQTPSSLAGVRRPGLRTRYRIEVHAAEAVSSPLSIISLWETSAVVAV